MGITQKQTRNRKPILKLGFNSSALNLLEYLGDNGAAQSFIQAKKPAYFNEVRFKNAFYKLKKEELLLEKDGKIKLSDDGLIEYARAIVQKSDLLPEGIDCIVVFDIPETERKLRNFLSKLLDDLAFLRLQKSVWASPFDNAEPINELFKRLKIKKWIRIFTGKETR